MTSAKMRHLEMTSEEDDLDVESEFDSEFDHSFDDEDPDAQYDVDAVRPIDQWLEDYASHHQHSTNIAIHCVTSPLLLASTIGFLWAIPMPSAISEYGTWLNIGSFAVVAMLIYYSRLSVSLAAGMLVVGIAILLGTESLQRLFPLLVWQVSFIVFCGAWIAQVIGHTMEGRDIAIRSNLHFLLIGPLWVLAIAYRNSRIPY